MQGRQACVDGSGFVQGAAQVDGRIDISERSRAELNPEKSVRLGPLASQIDETAQDGLSVQCGRRSFENFDRLESKSFIRRAVAAAKTVQVGGEGSIKAPDTVVVPA